MRSSPCLHRAVAAAFLATLAISQASLAIPTAVFELRLAPGSPDAVLDVGNPADQQLDLELWINLANGPLPSDVYGYSFQLVPSLDGVISYKAGSFANTLPFNPPQIQGLDNHSATNQPLSGAFSRGVFSLWGVPMDLGATKVATFSVTALSPGQVGYSFVASPPSRPWTLAFLEYDITPTAAATPAMTITVLPEPAGAAMILLAMGWVARRSTRHGCR